MRHVSDEALLRVRDAADAIVRDDALRTIVFAEAVLDATPEIAMLPELAVKMEALGVTTPRGEPYPVEALRSNRAIAVEWRGQWLAEAAFRTHQEAIGPNTDAGKILKALCAVARGENVPRPPAAELEAWKNACTSVRIAMGKNRRFMVSANALRTAMGRKPNVPGRFGPEMEAPDPIVSAIRTVENNPVAAARMLKNPKVRAAFSAAYGAHARAEDDRIEAQDRRTAGGLAEMSGFNEAGLRLDQAESRLDRAIELLSQVGASKKNTTEIMEIVDRIGQKLEFIRSWAEGGSLDEALENILEGR